MNKILDLKVGWSCNNNCCHCVVANKRHYTFQQDFSLDEIKRMFLQWSSDANTIVLTGGEPTLRKDIVEICRFIKQQKPEVSLCLQTNGRKLSNQVLLNQLLPLVDDFTIAIHSCRKEIHDFITSTKGSWDETMTAIAHILNHDPKKLTTVTVISKYNLDDLYKTFLLLHSLGQFWKQLVFPHAMGNAWANFEQVVPKYSEIENIIKLIIKDFGDFIIPSAIPPCYLTSNSRMMIEALKEYAGANKEAVCMELCDQTGDEFFSRIQKEFAKSPACHDCCFDNLCPGVWKEYIVKYKDSLDLRPIKEDNIQCII